MELETKEDLLVEHLQHLYDAEHRDLELLPDLIDAASDPSLARTLEERHRVTSEQRRRLEECFNRLEHTPVRDECGAMAGMAERAERALEAASDDGVRDSAIAASRRRIAHYGTAGYAVARDLARQLGAHDVADLLEQSRAEEASADEELAQLGNRVSLGGDVGAV